MPSPLPLWFLLLLLLLLLFLLLVLLCSIFCSAEHDIPSKVDTERPNRSRFGKKNFVESITGYILSRVSIRFRRRISAIPPDFSIRADAALPIGGKSGPLSTPSTFLFCLSLPPFPSGFFPPSLLKFHRYFPRLLLFAFLPSSAAPSASPSAFPPPLLSPLHRLLFIYQCGG